MESNHNILFLIDELGSGGAQRQMSELALGFRENGLDVRFLVYHDKNFYKEPLRDFHIEVVEEKNYVKRLLKLRRYIRSGGFDAVLSFLPSPNVVSCLSGFPRHKWRIVVGERSANPAIEENMVERLKLKTYRFADFVVSNSYTNLEMVSRVLPRIRKSRMKVIYNIVDFLRFHPSETTSERADAGIRIVIASRHHSLKNLDGLIEAVNLLPDNTRKNLRIDWYGDAGSDDSLEKGQKKISELELDGIFSFHPPVSDIETVIADACAVGLFSFFEGLPNAVCEGMAMGKPVIASAVSDVPLLIDEKRLLCDPKNPGSIAASLEYLLSLTPEEKERIGSGNHRKALELFNRNHILNQYLKLLLP